MRKILFICIIIFLLLFNLIAKSNYRIQIGDVLKIYVWKHSNFDRTVKVNIEGEIIYDVIGKSIKVEGLSIAELVKILAAELSDIIFEPKVVIDIKEFQKNMIIILGDGINENIYTFSKKITLIEALKKAGWSYDKNKSTNLKIIKREGKVVEVRVSDIIELGKSEYNLTFNNGDIVYVSEKSRKIALPKIKVLITGDIPSPNIYEYKQGIKLITALQKAGWKFDKTKNNRVTLLRVKPDEKVEILINEVFNGEIEKNITIKDDDIIYVFKEKLSPVYKSKKSEQEKDYLPGSNEMSFEEDKSPKKIKLFLFGKDLQVQGQVEVKKNFVILDLLELIKWKFDRNYYTSLEIINKTKKKLIHNLENTITVNSDILKISLTNDDVIKIEKIPVTEKINIYIVSELYKTDKLLVDSNFSLLDLLKTINYKLDESYINTLNVYRQGNLENSYIIENDFDKLNSDFVFYNNDVVFIERFNKFKSITLYGDSIKENTYKIYSFEKLIDLLKKANFRLNENLIHIAYIKNNKGVNDAVILNDLINLNKEEMNLKLNDGDYIRITDYVEISYNNSVMQVPKNKIISYEFKIKNVNAFDIIERIRNYFANKNSVILNQAGNAIIIKESPLKIKEIIPIINNLDTVRTIKQFRISAQIVEVTLNNEDEFGFSFSELENPDNINSKNFFNYSLTGEMIFKSYPSNIYMMLNALKKNGKVNTLSRPKIVTVDKKEAEILVGTQIPYRKTLFDISATDQSSANQISYEFKDVFIRLKVMPEFIFPDKILLKIEPEVNSLAGYTGDNQPIINARKASTNIIIKSGETVFIGGIISTSSTDDESKSKLFEKIPLLNSIFTSRKKTKSKNELIVLLTCELID